MKILLVYPNFFDAFCPNLSLTHLATYINKRTNHKASILDLTLNKTNWLKVLKNSLKNVDVIGFTTTIPTIIPSIKVAKAIKGINPNIPIIMGGIYATCVNREILEFDVVDYICVGEGEISLSSFMDNLENGSKYEDLIKNKGIWFKHNGNIIENGVSPIIGDLDSLPFLNYDLWNAKKIFQIVNHLPMMGSRGCQFNCAFCAQWAMHQIYDDYNDFGYYRVRSPTNICDEIEFQIKKYEKIKKFKGILFNDDTFTSNRKWVIDFCNEYIERGLHKKLLWAINARIDTVDKELLLKMRKAGCYYLYFGIESPSEKTLDFYNKRFKPGAVENVISLAKKMGYNIKTYFIINGPGENVVDSLRTLKYAWSLKPDTFHFMPFVPIPHTKAAEIYKSQNPKSYKQVHDIIDLKNYHEEIGVNSGQKSMFYMLISIVIGHMPIPYLSVFKNLTMGLFSIDPEKKLYSLIILSTMWKYFITSMILGKLNFIKDIIRFIKWMVHYKMVIADLFYFTLKKYQLDNSFI